MLLCSSPILPLPISVQVHALTSSGSMSLNSMFRPVQMIRCPFAGLSRSVSKNCQSCREPRRWYGRQSCFPLPAGTHNTNDYSVLFPRVPSSKTSIRRLTLQSFWHNASVIIDQTRIPVRTKACGGSIESD